MPYDIDSEAQKCFTEIVTGRHDGPPENAAQKIARYMREAARKQKSE